MEARRLYLDTALRAFVADASGSSAPAPTTWFQEDVEAIELYFVKNGQFVDYSANTVKLAVGLTAPAALQTSWTAINTAVAATVNTTQSGGSGADEIQRISFAKVPISGSFAIQIPSRNVTVSSVSAGVFTATNHGLVDSQSVTLTGFSGATNFANGNTVFVRDRTTNTFKVATTAGGTAISAGASGGGTAELAAITTTQIAADATAQTVQGALASAIGTTAILVTGSYRDGYVLTYSGAMGGINYAQLSVVNNTLLAAPGLTANLSFNTTEVGSLVSAGTTSDLRLECEITSGSIRQTYATTCSIADDIITSTSAAPLPTITPASSFNLTAPDTSVWNITIDDDGVLTATKT